MRRVVVTGMGIIAASGNGKEEFFNGMLSGKSFVGRISSFDPSEFKSQVAAEIKNFDPAKYMEPKEVRHHDRYTQLGLAAAKEAVEDAGLSKALLEKAGVIVASGIGGIKSLETELEVMISKGPSRVSPFLVPMMIADTLSGTIATEYGAKGPNFGTVSACASGAHAIAVAYDMIKHGIVDTIITGGSEAAICRISIAGFGNMKALSTRNNDPEHASRPFDRERDGFVMGEGAGIMVLESLESAQKRGAKIYAEIKGYGMSDDAYHMVQPDPEGSGAYAAMKMAIESSKVKIEDINYVNAHATSTPVGDVAEANAIKRIFGGYSDKIFVSSNKGAIGHTLGAAGAIEFIASVLGMKESVIFPTVNLEDLDPQITLNCVPGKPLNVKIKNFISNSFGFGGHNVSLIAGEVE
ncbi:MAG: beta-ketoacyl-[acyl-carrier-protein] synthase II [Mesoaciditoga sp.]|uniref:beta-ketoacyl-ACP synthase II n=1 Tax=Athalassotoga sp. TaxID=2022597 RepID=UPI000CC50C91|nr:MAG: beta-ketoacyl-[acyl-carrier-protein] synthase II [Mesoaciditoga sp.]PMP80672.1 MAG: beta-ketoacyl-[acyl-carrier-protein] synthase II [Mesoaciditoga sp.]HEU24124.1 beta-ketoacyl-[acyl-carrier-protein] synthase II [Mesoaciditoga lauensis]